MGTPVLGGSWLTERHDAPLLIVGPSLGTSAAQLWQPVVDRLPGDFSVLAFDLPGHAGTPSGTAVSIADLAAAVLALVDGQFGSGASFAYAGDSVGGAVGLQLAIDAPARLTGLVVLSTGAQIGDPNAWLDRAALVRAEGTSAVVDGSMLRWFSAATARSRPDLLANMSETLLRVEREGYAQVCEALAAFDVREQLPRITAPVLAVAGAEDVPTPVANLALIADRVADGRLVVLADVAHLPPVEAPDAVASLMAEHLQHTRVP